MEKIFIHIPQKIMNILKKKIKIFLVKYFFTKKN